MYYRTLINDILYIFQIIKEHTEWHNFPDRTIIPDCTIIKDTRVFMPNQYINVMSYCHQNN